jgi:hypothetical protein
MNRHFYDVWYVENQYTTIRFYFTYPLRTNICDLCDSQTESYGELTEPSGLYSQWEGLSYERGHSYDLANGNPLGPRCSQDEY